MRANRDVRLQAKNCVELARQLGTHATLRKISAESIDREARFHARQNMNVGSALLDGQSERDIAERAQLARAVLKILDRENLGRMS